MTVADQLSAHSPGSLILSFYGAYGRRELAGSVPVALLIRLMAAADVDAPSVRSAVSRLKRRGLLVSERSGGAAGYGLSDAARQVLADGDRRIYGPPPQPGGDWLLAVFSVPESERAKRHVLRSRLARLGFGTASPGVWIAPAGLLEETRHTLDRLGLASYVDLFQGVHAGFAPTAQAVRRWWDLDELAARHREFLAAHEPALDRWAQRAPEPAEAFRDHLRALDSWRRLPYADPGLPAAVLPGGWPGTRSRAVFLRLDAALREAGATFVREVRASG